MLSLEPLLSQLTIKTKSLEQRRFDLHYQDPDMGDLGWAQRPFIGEIERQYNAGKPVRIIVLKARQLGISTATEGVLFWWAFLHPGTNGLVLSHENTPSTELFEMTKLYWDTFPYKSLYTLKYGTKQLLHWLETRSRLRVATAKNLQSGRGSTLHAVHASEAAFYPDPETLWTGLNQTIPHRHGTIVILESTANGVGNWFYNTWMEAEEGESDFVPLFFPWFKHPEYSLLTTLTIRSELDADEKQLLRIGATYENLAWRRWAIINKASSDLSLFHQEYPSTPEEAFITSGNPIFSHKHLKECYVPLDGHRGDLLKGGDGRVRFIPDPDGRLTIFKRPRRGDTRWDRYYVSGDPSEAVVGDPSCAQVINRQTYEQVAVWHGQINPRHFAKQMMLIGQFYNWAELCPEVEGGGQATIGKILDDGYPHVFLHKRPDSVKPSTNTFGWSTNWQRKSWCIGTAQEMFMDHSVTIHDRKTYNQLRTYVNRDDGTWGNATGETHDDAVMALAICLTASRAQGPFIPDALTDNVVYDIYQQEYEGAV